MRYARYAAALLAMIMGTTNLLYAQKPTPKSGPGIPGTDLSKSNLGSLLEQMQTTTAPASDESPTPIQVVVQFLQLNPNQQQEFGALLEARQTQVAPLLVGIQQRAQQLEVLLTSGASPAEVGALAIQIHALQQQVVQAQQEFLSKFTTLLDSDKQKRLETVRIAAQLQPVLPAFQQLSLF